MVLVLKRPRRQGHGLKSHPTDWERLGIQPATPRLQDIGLSPTPQQLLCINIAKVQSKPSQHNVDIQKIKTKKNKTLVFHKINNCFLV